MQTLTGTRFSMHAEVLKQGNVNIDDPVDPEDLGSWQDNQDPLTGEIIRIWVPYPDDPNTPVDENARHGTIKCLARGIVDGGIRVAGTTERFGDTYENIDYVKMWVPPKTLITKRDRITNIRSKTGHIFWVDEENAGNPRATVFNVNGVTPLFDAFNYHVENFVLLERAEI